MIKKNKNQEDYEFINSVSQAMVKKAPNSTRVILYLILSLVFLFLLWAYFAKIDQLVRGDSKVIPHGQNKIVQNFEGGIITNILVEEGNLVKKGDVLLKLEDKQSWATYEKNLLEIDALIAKKQRAYAEANDKGYVLKNNKYSKEEYKLYLSNKKNLESRLNIFDEQISQKRKEKREIRSRISHLKQSFNLIREEQEVMEPLVKKGIVSKVEFLKLLREANTIKDELESTRLSLTRVDSSVKEYENRKKEVKLEFQNESQKEYNELVSKIELSSTQNQGLEDQVNRTSVVSPVSGYIKTMFVNTIGGSVKPGMDLVEIVPSNKKLLVEAKIKPEDIAFLYHNQEVSLKFSAYDFSIYGALKGKLVKISPDSTTDKEQNTFYTVHIETEKNYLGEDENRLKIMPGMRGSADILTGQRTILTYLLKPIIKTKHYAFSEN